MTLNHSSDIQFEVLLPILKEYGIVKNIGTIVCNNAFSNATLCRTIGLYLEEEEGISQDPSFQQIRYIGYIINLTVQVYLFSTSTKDIKSYDKREGSQSEEKASRYQKSIGSFRKLYNIANYIRGSLARIVEFKTLIGKRGLVTLINKNQPFYLIRPRGRKPLPTNCLNSTIQDKELRIQLAILQSFLKDPMDF